MRATIEGEWQSLLIAAAAPATDRNGYEKVAAHLTENPPAAQSLGSIGGLLPSRARFSLADCAGDRPKVAKSVEEHSSTLGRQQGRAL